MYMLKFYWISGLSLGFESILEGLFGPELVEDLKLFKGKNLRPF